MNYECPILLIFTLYCPDSTTELDKQCSWTLHMFEHSLKWSFRLKKHNTTSSCSVFSLAWLSQALSPNAETNWTVLHRLSACPQSLVWRDVSIVQTSWCLSSRRGQVCRMWARVRSSTPHLQEAVCESAILFRCFLGPQCSVLRHNIVGCSHLLRWWMRSCSGLYPSCFLCQSTSVVSAKWTNQER